MKDTAMGPKGSGKERDVSERGDRTTPGEDREVVVDISDLYVYYNSTPVLEGVDLQIYEGDFMGIIGPNGGGKSTLLKAILGLLPIRRGRVRIYGKEPEEGRKLVGYVPQYSKFDKDFPISVWDVVLMGRLPKRKVLSWYSREDKKAAREALGSVDMLEYRDKQIDELSGGQKQRVFIARALSARPRILLLDEPTASVDKAMQESVYNLLRELNKEVTIVLVTHDVGVISSYVGRIACLNHKLFIHDDDSQITKEMLEEGYQCPIDLVAHGVPHRMFGDHDHQE